ncbi:MAG: bifunctional 4-hydroxy-2-oxoglutarate aldolase/2-dehydro-3-deoxy-phosphogluconate aldolase [Chloroflexi bacterium]|nr:bifunctional 4-hydroxy-2-oxoglutarate aldolase/2-dehydro-3-deoxy-phosphogluconate aldolase [Chloroflexota bacterium]
MHDSDLDRLFRTGVIAIMRRTEATLAVETAEALLAGGVDIVEVTLNTHGAESMIRALALHFGERLLIGAGTVMAADAVARVVDCGGRFVVSPHFDRGIVEAARHRDLPSLPGAFTPTEIVAAWNAGASAVKVFPIGSVGPRYLRDVLAPLTEIPLVPTGGVNLQHTGDLIRAGARGLGLGSDLVAPAAVAGRDFDRITQRAAAFVTEICSARGQT